MHRIIVGGTGLIGSQLAHHWLKQGHQMTIIGRSVRKIQRLFHHNVNAIEFKMLTKEIFLELKS